MAALRLDPEFDAVSTTLTESTSPSTQSPRHARSSQTSMPSSPLSALFSRRASQLPVPPPPLTKLPDNDDVVEGWPQLARLMAARPELEAFPRFEEENVKILLYYQIEIADLKEQLQDEEKKDRDRQRTEKKKFAKHADLLVGTSHEQWQLVVRLRKCLKEYNAALLQYAQVSALPQPRSHNMECLQQWLLRTDLGNHCIDGSGSDAWGSLIDPVKDAPSLGERTAQLLRSIFLPGHAPRTKAGLAVTRPRADVDSCTRWVEDELLPCYHYLRNANKKTDDLGISRYSERSLLALTSYAATILACLMPVASIAVLSTVHGNRDRIILIGGLTLTFSLCLTYFCSGLAREKVFTATCAFCAVLVVFVQNQ